MDLPKGYQKKLQRAYPDVRMRWAQDGSECWLLERKANFKRVEPDPNKYPREAIDTFIRHKDGYYLAGFYAAAHLPRIDRLIPFLHSQDVTRMDLGGGTNADKAGRLAERLEARENAVKARARASQTFEATGAGAELYDQLAWDEGRRVAVPQQFGSGKKPPDHHLG